MDGKTCKKYAIYIYNIRLNFAAYSHTDFYKCIVSSIYMYVYSFRNIIRTKCIITTSRTCAWTNQQNELILNIHKYKK